MSAQITLRPYRNDDCEAVVRLFYETIHSVNAKDYTQEQLSAWAPAEQDLARWDNSLAAHDTIVAELEGELVGFADMDGSGYFDRLYVHRNHQGKGIASLLAGELERQVLERGVTRFITDASITARPFFEHRGYRIVREQSVERNGVTMTNYRMEKNLSAK